MFPSLGVAKASQIPLLAMRPSLWQSPLNCYPNPCQPLCSLGSQRPLTWTQVLGLEKRLVDWFVMFVGWLLAFQVFLDPIWVAFAEDCTRGSLF